MCHNTRSRSGASEPKISATRSRLNALLVSGGAGRARNRTSGSPASQPCSRQYPHADASAVNRMLNVFADFPPHTNMNQTLTRSGSESRSATSVSAPKSATSRPSAAAYVARVFATVIVPR
ncbi:hypothetical protein [Nocardia niigatensis]